MSITASYSVDVLLNLGIVGVIIKVAVVVKVDQL